MECPSCHSEMPDDSRFCEACGAVPPVRCPACGATSRAGARFCSNCGKTLTLEGAGPPTKPATTPISPATHPTASRERRQLTIMFCDLSARQPFRPGSTLRSSQAAAGWYQGLPIRMHKDAIRK